MNNRTGKPNACVSTTVSDVVQALTNIWDLK